MAADGKYVRADFTYDKERPSAVVLELEKGFLAGRWHYVVMVPAFRICGDPTVRAA